MARSEVTPRLRAIGDAIWDRRTRLGLTQREVADLAGISVARLRDIEVGHRASRRTYLKVAEALGMTVDRMDELTKGEVRT